jgi:ATP-dependent Lon protease
MKTIKHHTGQDTIPEMLPVIPTMDVVVFPNMIVPLLVLDEKIINGINKSLHDSKLVLLLAAQHQVDHQGAIGTSDLYQVGTIANVMRLINMPDGGIKILVQGICKGAVKSIHAEDNMLHAIVELLNTHEYTPEELAPQIRSIKSIAEKIVSTGHTFSPDFHLVLSKMQDPDKITDLVLSHINLTVDQSQQLLEVTDQKDLLEKLYGYLNNEIEVAAIEERIKNHARESMNQSQKEFYLREQLKAIKKELGEDDAEEIDLMRQKMQDLGLSDEIHAEVNRHINRLERTAPDSLEATVTRNYLEWIFALPWNIETTDNLDIQHAHTILNDEHFGLKEIKERILDFISVRKLKQNGFAPILCFVGPPGTGKTSLGQSIARSLGRKYARISLGGVKDEAEIRGHRRTYVGAMPGRFIQAIRKAESCNPVLIIDELDKIGADFRGDPSAAMLEVLDPQQNTTFYDNYLGIPFDLSKCLFIATANTIDTISGPLRDRMEIIELSGYTIEEKSHIARRHLITRAVHETGIEPHQLTLSNDIVQDLIMNYTRESGVRQLERIIKKLGSKVARTFVEKNEAIQFNSQNIETYLGPRKFLDDEGNHESQIGISNGLAWTAYGGEMIKIEAVLMPGNGKLLLTGQLGDVMKESAQAAMSYARAHAKEFGIQQRLFTKNDLHIHVPAGAIPKDGPSAGITMLTAILSAFTNKPIDSHYAMTGELNLRGEVMPIGGVKEKILAAKRNKVPHVILPFKNKNDLVGIIEEVSLGIDIVWVNHADEVIKRVLMPIVDKPKDFKIH